MNWMGWVLVSLAVLGGAWLVFDGTRALVTGDYVTPRTGEHAGRLGPWAGVVSAIGVEPRSTVMKTAHVVLGVAWIVAAASFVTGAAWGRWSLAACAVASLWYLPIGTLLALVELGLLFVTGRGGR
jgi:hypothetical protein